MIRIQFHRKLIALTNHTPAEVIRTTRIKRAAELLGNVPALWERLPYWWDLIIPLISPKSTKYTISTKLQTATATATFSLLTLIKQTAAN